MKPIIKELLLFIKEKKLTFLYPFLLILLILISIVIIWENIAPSIVLYSF